MSGLLALALVYAWPWTADAQQHVQRSQATAAPPPAVTAPLVIEVATVIDVQDGRRRPAQTVVIVGNRVRAVGDARKIKLPPGARVVNGRGKYLVPGLWDMHVHPMQAAQSFYPLFLANGVTGVRELGDVLPLDSLLKRRREIVAGQRVGPRVLGTGGYLQSPESLTSAPSDAPFAVIIRTPEDARRAVDSGILHRAGVQLLAGTDDGPLWGSGLIPGSPLPGGSLHEELALLVDAGLTPLEALQTATLNPAKFFAATDSLGSVAPGKLADLLLLDADPLVDIKNTKTINAVVANGRLFDRGALDTLSTSQPRQP